MDGTVINITDGIGNRTDGNGGVDGAVNGTDGSVGGFDGIDGTGGGTSPADCEWWLRRAIALTVLACPCALIVAIPITHACGVSGMARWAVLVKNGRQMELLARVKVLAVDKTGTLTEGCFRLHRMILGETGGEAVRSGKE